MRVRERVRLDCNGICNDKFLALILTFLPFFDYLVTLVRFVILVRPFLAHKLRESMNVHTLTSIRPYSIPQFLNSSISQPIQCLISPQNIAIFLNKKHITHSLNIISPFTSLHITSFYFISPPHNSRSIQSLARHRFSCQLSCNHFFEI